MQFAHSELIINKDGSIYHLLLRPEQVAHTIITVGDPDRVNMVSRHFDSIEYQVHGREFVTHTGYFGNKRITVISTGIGTDNVEIVLNELDALVNIDFETRTTKPNPTSLTIIRLGTSGSIQEWLELDSLIFAEYAFGFDNLLHYYQRSEQIELEKSLKETLVQNGYPTLNPYATQADPILAERFKQQGFISGNAATLPGFYAPQGRALRAMPKGTPLPHALEHWSYNGVQITNFEMETAGIFGMSSILGHKALSVSAILANRQLQTFSTQAEKTINSMIEKALEIISLH